MSDEEKVKEKQPSGTMEEEEIEASKVSVKIPPFWLERPDVWFRQVEAQFKLSGVKRESTMFDYLVSQLERRYVADILDILDSGVENKYTLTKQRLLSLYCESDDKQLKRLLAGLELGDLRPSQLLRKMQSLASNDVSNKVLRTLWLDKLPESVRNILLVSDEGLDKLAVMADKITDMSSVRDVYDVKKAESSDETPKSSTEKLIQDLTNRIQSLELQLASVNHRSRSQIRSGSPYSRKRSSSRSRNRYNPDGRFCYFHYRFGKRCRPEKCEQPCTWKDSENSKTQQN